MDSNNEVKHYSIKTTLSKHKFDGFSPFRNKNKHKHEYLKTEINIRDHFDGVHNLFNHWKCIHVTLTCTNMHTRANKKFNLQEQSNKNNKKQETTILDHGSAKERNINKNSILCNSTTRSSEHWNSYQFVIYRWSNEKNSNQYCCCCETNCATRILFVAVYVCVHVNSSKESFKDSDLVLFMSCCCWCYCCFDFFALFLVGFYILLFRFLCLSIAFAFRFLFSS